MSSGGNTGTNMQGATILKVGNSQPLAAQNLMMAFVMCYTQIQIFSIFTLRFTENELDCEHTWIPRAVTSEIIYLVH